MRYFVILNGPRGLPTPMVNYSEDGDSEEVALFSYSHEAEEAARISPLGRSRGYRIYPWTPEGLG